MPIDYSRFSRHSSPCLRAAAIAAVLAAIPLSPARAQQPAPAPPAAPADPRARLGLTASGAFDLHAGAGIFRHASLGPEFGGTLDLGWVGSPRVRLAIGVDYLRTTIDRRDSRGEQARGSGYIFSALADLNLITLPRRRIAPYVGIGFGIDAVGSDIVNDEIAAAYNTNVFDVHGQVGFLAPLSARGALRFEVRATEARVVRRIGARLGYSWLFNDLAGLRP